ncbi:MAG TPA: four-carbon acid sugar kinase family protein [Candidatus Sulfotelmatobacter sp.]|nr:four-carbon acid sugar kinase family protein [Candidatus Sulfotelmatobacter sp.]
MTGRTRRGGKPIRLGLIADDLTGANDTGVQFARRGARTIVPLDWHDLETLGRDADVLALNTNSRALTPRVAAQRARVAAEALRRAGVEAVYKKIDSTFRGNVGAELDAILAVYPAPLAFLTPAFPPAGRAVRDGILTVQGIPVHRTAIGRDPVTPVHESHLPTLLGRQCRRPVHSLSLAALRGGALAQARLLASWRAQESAVVVADAATAGDLARLARLLLREQLFGVAAGSAGLAEALSRALCWRRRPGAGAPDGKGAMLVVVGSPNPVSLEQIAWAESREQVPVVRATLREILGDGDCYRRELERVVRKLRPEVTAGRDAILTLAQRNADPTRRPLRPTASRTLSEFLGQAARRLAGGGGLGGLVLCGGDIAMAACGALGARGVELRGEVEPGVPWGQLVGGDLAGLPTVTKAGGFGQPSAFARALRFLRRAR